MKKMHTLTKRDIKKLNAIGKRIDNLTSAILAEIYDARSIIGFEHKDAGFGIDVKIGYHPDDWEITMEMGDDPSKALVIYAFESIKKWNEEAQNQNLAEAESMIAQ